MIGTHPMANLAPLDYRYALDAAMPLLAGKTPPILRCNLPELEREVRQRIPDWAGASVARAGLWIEPLADTWQAELQALASALPASAPLVVVASRPLARLLPERRSWGGQPLGFRPGGISRLRRGLRGAGLVLEASYGIHSAVAIGLNALSWQLAHLGRPDLADRIHFAARLRYCAEGPLAVLSTVALLIARKESEE
ncbi:MAG TPA: hypothetical protein VF909_11495 [Roseiflexaceae bacterium]